jgi:hypothetical protein
MVVIKKPLFRKSDIPTIINQVELSDSDIEKLSYGESSGLLKNLTFDEGELRDGKIRLSRDESGQLEVNYMFSKPNITIPKQLEDYVIPERDRLRLMNNETVGPFVYRGQHMFLQVDHDINRIVVKSAHEINVPQKIAGYTLTAEDMNTLANGGKMSNHLFCIDGKYYTAEIGMTGDKRGLFFDNYKDQNHLSKEQLKELGKALNKPSGSIPPLELSPALETVKELKKKELLLKEGKFAKYSLNPADDKYLIEGGFTKQQEVFRDAVDNYNVNMIVHLKESGFAPDQSDIDFIKNNINLDNEEKRVMGTVLEINHKEITFDEYNRPDHVSYTQQSVNKDTVLPEKVPYKSVEPAKDSQLPDRTESESAEKQNFQNTGATVDLEQSPGKNPKPAEHVTTQKVGNLISEAFNNM